MIFFLLLFSHCDNVKIVAPEIASGIGHHEIPVTTADAASGFSTKAIQPALSQEVAHSKKKRVEQKKSGYNMEESHLTGTTGRNSNSLMISRLEHLRSEGIEPDLNEPVSKSYLFSAIDSPAFPSMITLSHESFLKVDFDNDILDYTDRFYTNGIKFEMIAPGLQSNPLGRLMIPYWGSGTNYYGLSLVQNMYTPSTTKIGGILYGDRPYAAYLYLGSFKITNDPRHHFRQTSEIDAGIIGPNSYGEWVQRSFHNSIPTNNEPLGWEYQVQNDLVLNYMLSYEKGIFNGRNFDVLLSSAANLGTLYTNITGGCQFRTGWLNPYFANLGVSRKKKLDDSGLRKMQFYFFVKGSGKLVGYDATLQGGLFNKKSSYTLPADQISRMVFQGSAGITLSCNGISLDLEQIMLSPEFQNGWWHKWVHVALTFSL